MKDKSAEKAERQLARQQVSGEAAAKPRVDAPPHNHPDVPRDTPAQASTKDEGPDSQEMLDAARVMATNKQMIIGGHLGVVILTSYRPGFGFSGEHHRNYSMNTGEKPPIITALPSEAAAYFEGTTNPFSWVELGESTHVLRNLQRHLAAREPESGASE